MAEYIYCLIEREFRKTGENIFKIGRTYQENFGRFKQYPKGSLLINQCLCVNSKEAEKALIKSCKEKFKLRKEYGNEYFEGVVYDIIDIMNNTLKSYRPTRNNMKLSIDSDCSSDSSNSSTCNKKQLSGYPPNSLEIKPKKISMKIIRAKHN
jgi:hypothetical protein